MCVYTLYIYTLFKLERNKRNNNNNNNASLPSFCVFFFRVIYNIHTVTHEQQKHRKNYICEIFLRERKEKKMEASSNADDQHHLKQQEEKLRAKYGGMIPKKNLIVSDRKHFDSADYWSRGSNKQQHKEVVETEKNSSHFVESGADSSQEKMLKPVLGAKDVAGLGTSPPSDASTFTTNNNSSQTKRRTSMDESRGRWDVHSFNNNNNTAVNSAYHAPKNHE